VLNDASSTDERTFCSDLRSHTLMVLAASTPSVGSLAPEFTLTSQEGTPVSLKDYHGKWVVLYFYPKDFTSGCARC
jgi:peroxiredoxin Q/BCP